MDEYISKQLLIAKFKELANDYIDGEKRQRGLAYATAADMVALMKSADVQPVKRGRWKYYKNNGIFDTHKCTLCGEKYKIYMDIEPTTIYKYCPNCGARMDGDTE